MGINKVEYIKEMLKVWAYRNGKYVKQLQSKVAEIYGVGDTDIFLTGNGRTAQYLFLKSLNLPKGSKVAIQGYTCNAAVNPIIWAGLIPSYIDINPNTYSMDVDDLKRNVDDYTKVIIVQHTYGIPDPMDEILEFAKERGMYVFEDCAHALGMKDEQGRILGSRGDASLISFGIDKVLTTRVGGALLVNNTQLIGSVKAEYSGYKVMKFGEILMWMVNPFIWFVLGRLKGMRRKLGLFLTSIKVLNMGFYSCEFKAQMPKEYPRKFANVLSWFVISELNKLDNNIQHRREVVGMYEDRFKDCVGREWGIPLVKYPIQLSSRKERDELHKNLFSKNILVSKWYDPVIFPEGKGFSPMMYTPGSCPNAEEVSKTILALPTGFTVNIGTAEYIEKQVG